MEAIWVDIFYLSMIIMILYLLDPDLRKQRIRMSHSNASSRTLVSMSWKHEVIFQTLFIAGFKPETFTSQTFKSEPITTGATTLVVGYYVISQFVTLINTFVLYFYFHKVYRWNHREGLTLKLCCINCYFGICTYWFKL